MARFPNLDPARLAEVMNRGEDMSGPTKGPSPAGMRQQRTASGGATAGTGANPSRTGNPARRGVGGSLVPNAAPHIHALTRASLAHLKAIGRPHPEHHDIMRATQGHLDSYAVSKRQQAVRASQPKAPRGFGSLAGDDPAQSGLLSSGGGTAVPSADATMTGMSPLKQKTSGGRSQVPNASGGRRGPFDPDY